jgi:DNA-binding transcriptional LysR family regulator
MEMFELRYFSSVAQYENVARASEAIHVSPAALSKAVSRLEEELQTQLFFKSGRGIRLTPEGQRLKLRALKILLLEEEARLELLGYERGQVNVTVASDEILQTTFGVLILQKIDQLLPGARTRFLVRNEEAAVDQVIAGEVHLALTTQEVPVGLAAKVLARVSFQTCGSREHTLVRKNRLKRGLGTSAIGIDEVLKHAFVMPENAFLGRVNKASSLDGWRDDKFPRNVKYRVGGVKLMENLVREGRALAYLPDYFVSSAGLVPLTITGCPYTCQQTVRVVAQEPEELGWLARLWGKLG